MCSLFSILVSFHQQQPLHVAAAAARFVGVVFEIATSQEQHLGGQQPSVRLPPVPSEVARHLPQRHRHKGIRAVLLHREIRGDHKVGGCLLVFSAGFLTPFYFSKFVCFDITVCGLKISD